MGRVQPLATDETAVQAACRVNVGKLRDTGHSTQPMPPAAKAGRLTSAFARLDAGSDRLQPAANRKQKSPALGGASSFDAW